MLHMEKTIFEEIADDLSESEQHRESVTFWQLFLFTDDDVYKRIRGLERW